MNKSKPWYIEQRAEALALVYLTRRADLLVKSQDGLDYGIDYLVEILKAGRSTRRVFGLLLKAHRSIESEHAATVLMKSQPKFEQRVEELPFPICMFLFSVENDKGFYKWVIVPRIDTEGRPKLYLNPSEEFRKLDNNALDMIISQVNQWYDALVKALAA